MKVTESLQTENFAFIRHSVNIEDMILPTILEDHDELDNYHSLATINREETGTFKILFNRHAYVLEMAEQIKSNFDNRKKNAKTAPVESVNIFPLMEDELSKFWGMIEPHLSIIPPKEGVGTHRHYTDSVELLHEEIFDAKRHHCYDNKYTIDRVLRNKYNLELYGNKNIRVRPLRDQAYYQKMYQNRKTKPLTEASIRKAICCVAKQYMNVQFSEGSLHSGAVIKTNTNTKVGQCHILNMIKFYNLFDKIQSFVDTHIDSVYSWGHSKILQQDSILERMTEQDWEVAKNLVENVDSPFKAEYDVRSDLFKKQNSEER